MATQKIVRAIQKVRQQDGTYIPVLPINTSDDVYTDIGNKKTLKQELSEIVYKHDTISNGNTSISTFRDPFTYIGPEGDVDGDIMIKLPSGGTSDGINISVDISISGSDHAVLKTNNAYRIDSFPGTPNALGETTVYCSDMSKHGNVLLVSGGGGNYGLKAYTVQDNALTTIDIYETFNTPVIRCSVSEDGTFMAVQDSTSIYTYYRLSDNMYYLTGTVPVSSASTISSIKVLDPFRNISGQNNPNSRKAILVICYSSKAPSVYTFSAFGAPVADSNILPITDIILDMDTDTNGLWLYTRTTIASQSIVTYIFNESRGVYIRTLLSNLSAALMDLSVSPSRTHVTTLISTGSARIYETTSTGQSGLTIVKSITMPSDIVARRCRMIADKKVVFWGNASTTSNLGIIKLYDLDSDSWVDTTELNKYIGAMPNNIVMSANSRYGFVIKGSALSDTTAMILPLETNTAEIKPSIGMNELEAISSRFVAMSNDGKYIALVPKTSSTTTTIKIFKEENNSYKDITPSGLTSLVEANVVSLVGSEDGNTFVIATKTEVYAYRNNKLDTYLEKKVPDNAGGTNTCLALSEPYNGAHALFIGKETSPFVTVHAINSINSEFEIGTFSGAPAFANGDISTKVIGMSTYKQYYAYVATVDSADSTKFNISQFDIGGSSMLSNKNNMNSSKISGIGARVEFTISRNGEYIVAVDKTNGTGIFYGRMGGERTPTDMVFNEGQLRIEDFMDAVFDHDARFMYVLGKNNDITCYGIKDGQDSLDKTIIKLTEYTNGSMVAINKMLMVDTDSYSRLFVSGYAFPYMFIFDVDVVSGFVDINLSGTMLTESRTSDYAEPYNVYIWKNVTLTHNNPKLVKDIQVATSVNDNNGTIIVKSFDEKWFDHAVQINRFTVYGNLSEDVDYTVFSVSNVFSNPGVVNDAQSIQNSLGVYRDMNIIGTGTINGDQIVGITRLKNIVVSRSMWIDEKTSSDTGYYRYRIRDRHISADSMVNIDIKTPTDLTVASVAGIQSITVEGDGYVDIYSTNIPTANITVDVNIFR